MSERQKYHLNAYQRATLIADRNRPPAFAGGLVGGYQLFAELGSARSLKRRAAVTLTRIPANRAASMSFGRNPQRGVMQLLEQAGQLRRAALRPQMGWTPPPLFQLRLTHRPGRYAVPACHITAQEPRP